MPVVHPLENAAIAPKCREPQWKKIMEPIGLQRASICGEIFLGHHSPEQKGSRGQWSTLPMGKEDMKPHSHGEKGHSLFSSSKCLRREERESITKMVGPWHTHSLPWKVLPGREKSGCLWGSGRLARGVSMAQLEWIVLKKFFWKYIWRDPIFSRLLLHSFARPHFSGPKLSISNYKLSRCKLTPLSHSVPL